MEKSVESELAQLVRAHKTLKDSTVVVWARENTESALHQHFIWDDVEAANRYRLWQARTVMDVLSDERRRYRLLRQAFSELERLRMKYESLEELSQVFYEVRQARFGRW